MKLKKLSEYWNRNKEGWQPVTFRSASVSRNLVLFFFFPFVLCCFLFFGLLRSIRHFHNRSDGSICGLGSTDKGIHVFRIVITHQYIGWGKHLHLESCVHVSPSSREFTLDVSRGNFFLVCLISPISCWHVIRLSRQSVRLMNEWQNVHH